MNDNVYALFETRFRADRNAACVRLPDRDDWLYGDLEERVSRAAGALADLDVKPGDRVVTQTEKTPEALALYLGCLKIGAVYVPLNTAYTATEIEYFLSDAEPVLFVCDEAATGESTVPTATLDARGGGSFADRMDTAKPWEPTVSRTAVDIAAIVYTSGTTGRPKGAMLTHENLSSNARTLCDAWGWRSDDVLLHALPIFHVHGLFVALHCVFVGGGSMIFLPRFDADAVIEHLPRSTVMMGVPTFYARLLGHEAFTRDICHGMRLFISGSAPLAAQTFAGFRGADGTSDPGALWHVGDVDEHVESPGPASASEAPWDSPCAGSKPASRTMAACWGRAKSGVSRCAARTSFGAIGKCRTRRRRSSQATDSFKPATWA